MSFEDLAQHYRSADLVVFPSYYEGQGLIPLGALASGTPVVTVDQAPLTEMIDDTIGGLFDLGFRWRQKQYAMNSMDTSNA